jgi:hypothetical protein
MTISYVGMIFLLYFLLPIFWYLLTTEEGKTYVLDIECNILYVWLLSIFYFTETHNEYFVLEMVVGTILSILAHKVYKGIA